MQSRPVLLSSQIGVDQQIASRLHNLNDCHVEFQRLAESILLLGFTQPRVIVELVEVARYPLPGILRQFAFPPLLSRWITDHLQRFLQRGDITKQFSERQWNIFEFRITGRGHGHRMHVHAFGQQTDSCDYGRTCSFTCHTDAIGIDGIVPCNIPPDAFDGRHHTADIGRKRIGPEPPSTHAEIALGFSVRCFDHRDRHIVAQSILPQVEPVG